LNALFIIFLAPVFAWIWVKLGKYNPNTAVKFALALIFVGLGFGVLVFGISVSEAGKVAADLVSIDLSFTHYGRTLFITCWTFSSY
jgi:dipeptide/tripeptide permease